MGCALLLACVAALQTIDASIHRAYINLIRGAKRYLYLENQVWLPYKLQAQAFLPQLTDQRALDAHGVVLVYTACSSHSTCRTTSAKVDYPMLFLGLYGLTDTTLLCCPLFASTVLPGQLTPVGCVSVWAQGHCRAARTGLIA